MKTMLRVSAILCLCLPSYLTAEGVVDVQVQENQITGTISVASIYQAGLIITFENATGLTQDSVSLSAIQVDPLSSSLLNRLADPTSINIPAQFPILINVSPTSGSTLSFTGTYTIELSASNLSFDPTFRLFKAPNGGPFEDITIFSGMGSYRVAGTGGNFSDFLIVADLRPAGIIINSKFDKIQETLTMNAFQIGAQMLQNLQTQLDTARNYYNQGNSAQAASVLQSIIDDIEADNGNSIPNTYQANDPNVINVSGILRQQATTVIFSLGL